jgi:hypothetical protein
MCPSMLSPAVYEHHCRPLMTQEHLIQGGQQALSRVDAHALLPHAHCARRAGRRAQLLASHEPAWLACMVRVQSESLMACMVRKPCSWKLDADASLPQPMATDGMEAHG